MPTFGIEALKKNLDELMLVAQVNENIRKHFAGDGDLSTAAYKIDASNYLLAQNSIPEQLVWRIYDHSAFITRLYALYETFVLDLIRKWLEYLPRFYPLWVDLPDVVSVNYRIGIGVLLNKFGGPRTSHLTEVSLITGLFSGLSGKRKYSLMPEAFLMDLQNLRDSELINLTNKVGMAKFESWFINGNSKLGVFCAANSLSVKNKLKEFIEFRNQCAHGSIDIDDLLGVSELLLLKEFIFFTCESIVEFVLWNICQNASQKKYNSKCKKVGEIIEYYSRHDVSIVKMNKGRLAVGETLVIKNSYECYYTQVVSIQMDNIDVGEAVVKKGIELGVKFSKKIKRGSDVMRLVDII
jgi:MAE_28990/MAE_18760-like HEPN